MTYGIHTHLTKPREVLAIDAAHPDEKRAGLLYESLMAKPIPHVTAIIGNLAAYHAPVGENGRKPRYIDRNLMFSFPGNPHGDYEQRRAYQITQLGKKFGAVVDFHATEEDEHTVSYGARAYEVVRRIPTLQGIHHAIVLPRGSLVSTLPNAISIDTHDIDPKIYIATSRRLLRQLTESPSRKLPIKLHDEYHYAGTVSVAQMKQLGLAAIYPNFAELPTEQMAELGFDGPVRAWSWNATRYAHTGIAGDVVAINRPKKLILAEPTPGLITANETAS